MTEEEKRAHAERIIRELIDRPEFSLVYEDSVLEDVGDNDLEDIHDLMLSAKVSVSW